MRFDLLNAVGKYVMGLVILVVVGGILGWLASIIMQADDRQSVLTNVAVGIVGALAVGIATNGGSIIAGISAGALLLAFAGSVALLAVLNVVRLRTAR